jgi:hypothetical protein
VHRAEELILAASALLILCALGGRVVAEQTPAASVQKRWGEMAPPNSSSPEPKRIRTIRIRADDADGSDDETSSAAARVSAPGYYVQVGSRRTAAEAIASYRALQVKHSVVLGGREPDVQRVDLGEKGAFFRTQVGPFETNDDADAFCIRLNVNGGQCIVQKY